MASPSLPAGNSFALLYQSLAETALLDFRPSMTAAAMLAVCRQAAGIIPFWPGSLETLTGYAETPGSRFTSAEEVINSLMAHAWGSGIPAEYGYTQYEYSAAS